MGLGVVAVAVTYGCRRGTGPMTMRSRKMMGIQPFFVSMEEYVESSRFGVYSNRDLVSSNRDLVHTRMP